MKNRKFNCKLWDTRWWLMSEWNITPSFFYVQFHWIQGIYAMHCILLFSVFKIQEWNIAVKWISILILFFSGFTSICHCLQSSEKSYIVWLFMDAASRHKTHVWWMNGVGGWFVFKQFCFCTQYVRVPNKLIPRTYKSVAYSLTSPRGKINFGIIFTVVLLWNVLIN